VVIATEPEELLGALEALAKGESPANTLTGKTQPGARLAYLFTGQGSQRPGMGKELHETYPAYAEALDAACAEIDPLIERSLAQLIFSQQGSPEAELLDHTTYAQPALFATELALYRLLESLGLTAELLCGHSVGEIAAAHLAGVFDLQDAAKLVCARGELMGELPPGGAMLAIEATEAEVLASIEGREAELSLAAVNSPSSCVVSGNAEAIAQVEAHWREAGRKTKRLEVSHAFHSPLMDPMLDQFAELTATLTYNPPQLAIVSCLSGELLSAEQATDPAYWVSHVRQPVRFADAVQTLSSQGASSFLELGPDPVLCAMARQGLGEEGSEPTLAPALRQGRPEPETLLGTLACAHASGASPDWSAFFAGSGAEAVALPTYAFQRQRYWLNPAGGSSDPAALGQRPLDHPFLAAAIEDPEGEGVAFSGRLSLAEHPWLKDHAVLGTVLLPGTALLELALFAGEQAEAPTVQELTLQAPLVLVEEVAVALRVSLSAPDQEGCREIAIHSRPETEEGEWTRNAAGLLSPDAAEPSEPLSQWPPPGAEPIDPEDLHARLAEAGFEYGPAFGGLLAVWRDGGEVFAEVSLPAAQADGAASFALHPALLDAAFHPVALAAGEGVRMPFSWSGASLLGRGARELRVRLSGGGEESARIEIFDAGGAPVGRVDSVVGRPLDPTQLRAAMPPLYSLSWQKRPLAGRAPSPAEPWRAPAGAAATARESTAAALEKIQRWLAGEPEDSRLAILTQGAVAARDGESVDPAQAALWGLVRTALSEHPGRFLLIDSDGSEASEATLQQALTADSGQAQLALREGESFVPRLVPAKGEEDDPAAPLDPERTVLITGATGGLGALIAKHLVEAHGARHLLLVSRSGEQAPGALDLRAQLQETGAEVRIAACDVSDRGQLEELFDSTPHEHPLGAVIHCAAVLDDATIAAAGPEQLERVFAPKAEAAWHLHELTAALDLSHFVLFSSIAGLLGSPGQGAYAAANCFLDGLAAQRRGQGLPAGSIAWGLWVRESGMASQLGEAEMARMRRAGIRALSEREGFALFDRALASPRPLTAAVRFDRAALRAQAEAGGLSPLLEGMAPAGSGAATAATGTFSRRLLEVPEGARGRLAEDFVRAEVAAILGHASAEAIGPNDAFKDLGFDSLAAIELRNRLGAAIDRRLAASVVFDYPTAIALAAHLLEEAGDAGSAPGPDLGQLERALAGLSADDPARAELATRLRALAAELDGEGQANGASVADRLEGASDQELLDFIDTQVGPSRG
jgi:pimaricinolide synthase PimS1